MIKRKRKCKLRLITDSISFKKQCSNQTMFQLVHDYNALPIHGKLLIVLIINKTFLIFKSNNMRMFNFLVFSHIDRRLSFLKIFLVCYVH